MWRKLVFGTVVAFALVFTLPHVEPRSFWKLISPPDLVFIERSPGGVVDEFLEEREWYRKHGTKVVIGGDCYSACTLFLSLKTLCAQPDAEFHFHSPYLTSPTSGATHHSAGYDEWFVTLYPTPIREWIADNGGLTPEWLVLKGAEMKKLVPICEG